MKRYKHIYCVSLLYSFVKMFIVCFLSMILLAAIAHTNGRATFWQVFSAYCFAFAVLCVVGAIFILLVNIIYRLFSHKTVLVTETHISYPGYTLQLDDIRYITLYLPEVQGKHSVTPFELVLSVDDHHMLCIKRPSFLLVAALKKRCPTATFCINDWKAQLKECLWMQLVMIPVIAIMVYWDFK